MTNYEYLKGSEYKSSTVRDMAIEICKRNYGSCEKCYSDACDTTLTATRDWLMMEKKMLYAPEEEEARPIPVEEEPL